MTAGGLIKWKRIEGLPEDTRTEPHFDSYFKINMFHNMTKEVDVFNALLPLSKEALLEVVRENAQESNYTRVKKYKYIQGRDRFVGDRAKSNDARPRLWQSVVKRSV